MSNPLNEDVFEAKDEVCFFCGEMTNRWSGNPSYWLTFFARNGGATYAHVGCLSALVNEALDGPIKNEGVEETGPIHSSHKMRFSDSSLYDHICDNCGQPDWYSGTNPELAKPCKSTKGKTC